MLVFLLVPVLVHLLVWLPPLVLVLPSMAVAATSRLALAKGSLPTVGYGCWKVTAVLEKHCTPNCILHTLYCILHTTYCKHPTVYCKLYTPYCTPHCMIHTLYCILYTKHCTWHTKHCSLNCTLL